MNLSTAQADRRSRAEATHERLATELADRVCAAVDLAVSVPNFKLVTPAERKKLSGIISHYRKNPHPFSACVKDNTKRFGPERVKKVCAVVADMVHGTTKWRSGGKKKSGLSLAVPASCPVDLMTDDTFALLERVAAIDLAEILDGASDTDEKGA